MRAAVRMGMVVLLAVAGSGVARAQEIAGRWQGTMETARPARIVIEFSKGPDGALSGRGYVLDQDPNGVALSQVSVTGQTVRFAAEAYQVTYEGTLSPDGKTISGHLSQGKVNVLNLERATPETAWKIDSASHTVQWVEVQPGVKLEVLDWGGTGRPLVLLTGLGDNAHVFDKFAPKLTDKYHVYGITRRGFGTSSKPSEAAGYAADRLGEDVLAVIEALHLERPVVAGHSVAGEELSYLGTRHPDKVAGLIYLDAGYPYAMYDEVNGALAIDAKILREQLGSIGPGAAMSDLKKSLDEIAASLQRVEREVARQREDLEGVTPSAPPAGMKMPPQALAIQAGTMRFTTVNAPVLAIFADPHNFGDMMKDNPKARAAMIAVNNRDTERQAVAFERQVPKARVVRIPNASHYVMGSNEADVLREMNAFIATLP